MGKTLKTIFSCCVSALLAACGSLAAAGPDQPALMVDVTPDATEQLQRALVEANDGAPVTVADDVFTRSSQLALEQGRLADGPGRPLTGRDLGAPKIFSLVKNDRGCWLLREADGERWLLNKVSCIPENGREG